MAAYGSREIGCQAVDDVTWDAAALKWTNSPSVAPGAADARVTVLYELDEQQNPRVRCLSADGESLNWGRWMLPLEIQQAAAGSGILSLALASTDEGAPGWVYFAKKEYDPLKAARVAYAHGRPVEVLSLTLAESTVTGGSSTTGTVTLTAYAPPGGQQVQLLAWDPVINDDNMAVPTAASVPQSVTVPQGRRSVTFPVHTSGVTVGVTCPIEAAIGSDYEVADLRVVP